MPTNFLYMAEAQVKAKQQWANGETVTLWESGPMRVWLKNESGFLNLTFFIDSEKLTERYYHSLTVGMLSPGEGWKFSRDSEHSYDGWIRKVKESPAYRRTVRLPAAPATPAAPAPATAGQVSDCGKMVNGATGKTTIFPASAFFC